MPLTNPSKDELNQIILFITTGRGAVEGCLIAKSSQSVRQSDIEFVVYRGNLLNFYIILIIIADSCAGMADIDSFG